MGGLNRPEILKLLGQQLVLAASISIEEPVSYSPDESLKDQGNVKISIEPGR
jgi:hypothetical protein